MPSYFLENIRLTIIHDIRELDRTLFYWWVKNIDEFILSIQVFSVLEDKAMSAERIHVQKA